MFGNMLRTWTSLQLWKYSTAVSGSAKLPDLGNLSLLLKLCLRYADDQVTVVLGLVPNVIDCRGFAALQWTRLGCTRKGTDTLMEPFEHVLTDRVFPAIRECSVSSLQGIWNGSHQQGTKLLWRQVGNEKAACGFRGFRERGGISMNDKRGDRGEVDVRPPPLFFPHFFSHHHNRRYKISNHEGQIHCSYLLGLLAKIKCSLSA